MSTTDKNPAAVRVCAIADIQCSRDCGTGPCKREREARYPSTDKSRADALTPEALQPIKSKFGNQERWDCFEPMAREIEREVKKLLRLASPVEQHEAAPAEDGDQA